MSGTQAVAETITAWFAMSRTLQCGGPEDRRFPRQPDDPRFPQAPDRDDASPRPVRTPDHAERDTALLARLREGDGAAVTELLALYGAALLQHAARIVGSTDAAEDVVQDVLLRLWHQRDSLEITVSLAAYLFRMTRNHAVDMARAKGAAAARDARWVAELTADVPSAMNAGERATGDADARAEVLHALAGVPKRSQEIFMLAWEQNFTYAEIAHYFGISVPTVRNQMSRAVRHLARVYGPGVRG